MNNKKLEGNTATLPLSNWSALRIKVGNNGDYVLYQFINGDKYEEIEEAEIDYYEDVDNLTGYAEDEENLLQAGFKINNEVYFLAQFLRDNYGR